MFYNVCDMVVLCVSFCGVWVVLVFVMLSFESWVNVDVGKYECIELILCFGLVVLLDMCVIDMWVEDLLSV